MWRLCRGWVVLAASRLLPDCGGAAATRNTAALSGPGTLTRGRGVIQHSTLYLARYLDISTVIMYRLPSTSWEALKLKLYHRCLGVFYIYTCSLMCQSFKLWFLHGKSKVQIDCSTCLSTFWNNCVSQSQCSDISVRKKIQFHCVTLWFETRGRM